MAQTRHYHLVPEALQLLGTHQVSIKDLLVPIHFSVFRRTQVEHLRVENDLCHDHAQGKHVLLLRVVQDGLLLLLRGKVGEDLGCDVGEGVAGGVVWVERWVPSLQMFWW